MELTDVSFELGGKPVLNAVDLSVAHGVLLAIMGLNGAGKTTLLKLMSRYYKPLLGQHRIAGRAASDYSVRSLAREIAYVPQDFPTDFPFSVAEFVLMGRFSWHTGLFPGTVDMEKTAAILARLGLAELAARRIDTLSGGERQRVLLARALAQDARAILLDEPLNHLDIKNRLFVLDLLRQENACGRTIVAVMHDFREVRAHFHEVAFLKDGAMVFHGPVASGFDSERLRAVFDVDVPL